MNKKKVYLHSFKKLDHKTFCVSFAGILLIYFISMFLWLPMEVHGRFMPLPEAKNSHFEPADYEIPTIRIFRDGSVFLDYQIVEDKSKLFDMIKDRKGENKWGTRNKVLLKADSYLKFEIVVEILDILSKTRIKVVGLVTTGRSCRLDYYYYEEIRSRTNQGKNFKKER